MAIILTIQPTDSIQNYLDILNSYGGGILNLNPTATYFPTSSLNLYDNVALNLNGGTIDFGGNAYQILAQGANAYSTGTASVTAGGSTVTGSGTTWTIDMIGQSILLGDFWYEITGRSSNTSITIGETFKGTTLAGDTYVIADTINNMSISNGLITNSSISLVKGLYVNGFTVDSITVDTADRGFDFQDSANIVMPSYGISNCTTAGVFNNVPYCTFSNASILSSGVFGLTRVTNTSLNVISFQAGTGVGVSFTNCTNIGMVNYAIIKCASHGIEFVSGNSDIDTETGYINSCGGDGIKLTASSNNCTILDNSILNNGGYGVNIANANDNNTIVLGNHASGNSSGSINDAGTGTIAKVNQGITDIPASSGVTSISVATANGLAGSSSGGSTPALTLSTTITGVVKANGTAFSAAANSDLPAMSATVGGAVPTPPNNTTTFLRGDGIFAAPGGGASGLARAGGDATEHTTTSVTAVDLVTISGLSIPAGTRVKITGKGRKTTGAAAGIGLGLKVNSTIIYEATASSGIFFTDGSNNRAENGEFWIEFEVGETNYTSAFMRMFQNYITSSGFISSQSNDGVALDSVFPSATITSITIRGISGSGSVTAAAKNIQVYTFANS